MSEQVLCKPVLPPAGHGRRRPGVVSARRWAIRMRRLCPAFSLIELLIVVAIIAVLVGLLIPVVSKARQQASAVRCQSNLRQLAQAMLSYAAVNDELLPRAAYSWNRPLPENNGMAWSMDNVGLMNNGAGSLVPLLGGSQGVFVCPIDDGADLPRLGVTVNVVRNFSYSLNGGINLDDLHRDGTPLGTTLRIPSIVNPAQKILVFEERAPNDGVCICSAPDFDEYPGSRHFKKANYAFADGHVEALLPKDVFANPVYCDLTH